MADERGAIVESDSRLGAAATGTKAEIGVEALVAGLGIDAAMRAPNHDVVWTRDHTFECTHERVACARRLELATRAGMRRRVRRRVRSCVCS